MNKDDILVKILEQVQQQNEINNNLIVTLKELQESNKQLTKENIELKQTIKKDEHEVSQDIFTAKEVSNERIEPSLTENFNTDRNIAKINEIKVLPKFKDIARNHFIKMGKNFHLVSESKKSLKNIYDRIGVVVYDKYFSPNFIETYKSLKEQLSIIASKAGAKITNIIHAPQNIIYNNNINIVDKFFLIGDKKTISNLKKDFSLALELIGFEAEDLIYSNNNKKFFSIEQTSDRIEQKLEHQIKLKKELNQYILPALNGVEDNTKAEIIEKIIWPKIIENLNQSLGLYTYTSTIKAKNKYMILLNDFAERNNISAEAAINALDKNPELLETYKNIEIIKKEKDNILETSERYEILSRNTFIVLQSLIKVASTLQALVGKLDIDNKLNIIDQMDQTKLDSGTGKEHSFSTIRKNITKLLSNKTFINEIINSNENHKIKM